MKFFLNLLLLICVQGHLLAKDTNHWLNVLAKEDTSKALEHFDNEEYLIKHIDKSYELAFMKALLLFKAGKVDEAKKLIEGKVLKPAFKIKTGFYFNALGLLKKHDLKDVDALIRGYSDLELKFIFNEKPIKESKRVRLRNVETNEFIWVYPSYETKRPRTSFSNIIKPGRYKVEFSYKQKLYRFGEVTLNPWGRLSKTYSLDLYKTNKLLITKPAEGYIDSTGNPAFEWEYKLKDNEIFGIEIVKLPSETDAQKINHVLNEMKETTSHSIDLAGIKKGLSPLEDGEYCFRVYKLNKDDKDAPTKTLQYRAFTVNKSNKK